MSLNHAQWGLANLDTYNPNTGLNCSTMRHLSLVGLANLIYDLNAGTLSLDSVWDPAVIKSTYEGVGNPGPGDDTWRECLVEAQKFLGGNGPSPLVPATDPKTTEEREDGRLDPLNSVFLETLGP